MTITKHSNAIIAALLLIVSVQSVAAQEYACPLKVISEIRKPDDCAKEGGGFDSARSNGRVAGKHRSLDLNAKEGDEVRAIHAGKVIVADPNWEEKMGGTVILDHGNGEYSVYGHLNEVGVKVGAEVKAATKIGTVGYTGNAQCLKRNGIVPHLHIMIIRAGKSGLGSQGGPIAELKKWGTMWQTDFGAEITGPVNPNLIIGHLKCWTGDPNKP